MKRENKKKPSHLQEVTGARVELKELLNEEMDVNCFVTNTYGYQEQKRLVTEIVIGNYFIKHAWFKTERIGKLKHGYQKLPVKITEYIDQTSGESKYGLKYTGTEGNQYIDTFLTKPKWMKED